MENLAIIEGLLRDLVKSVDSVSEAKPTEGFVIQHHTSQIVLDI